jgi:hypothetical protein
MTIRCRGYRMSARATGSSLTDVALHDFPPFRPMDHLEQGRLIGSLSGLTAGSASA